MCVLSLSVGKNRADREFVRFDFDSMEYSKGTGTNEMSNFFLQQFS